MREESNLGTKTSNVAQFRLKKGKVCPKRSTAPVVIRASASKELSVTAPFTKGLHMLSATKGLANWKSWKGSIIEIQSA